ncbi:MAG: hypothetical protein JWO96_9 [Candidatus Saccharibacteria bacterium]|nr:hypothetical protein [Candidatus Saccharibacteria bacterium]
MTWHARKLLGDGLRVHAEPLAAPGTIDLKQYDRSFDLAVMQEIDGNRGEALTIYANWDVDMKLRAEHTVYGDYEAVTTRFDSQLPPEHNTMSRDEVTQWLKIAHDRLKMTPKEKRAARAQRPEFSLAEERN